MKMSPRRPLAAAAALAFLAQSVGAADLAPVLARGMFLPPPGRMAPQAPPPPPPPAPAPKPAPAKPAGPTWLEDARVVARWLADDGGPRAQAWLNSRLAPAPAPVDPDAERTPYFSAALPATDAPEPPRDRMLIVMGRGERLLAAGDEARLSNSLVPYRRDLKPLRAWFREKTIEGEGVRARVSYKNPLGTTQGTARGWRVRLSNGVDRIVPARAAIPETMRREFPLYFAGDEVEVELTLENLGAADLRGVEVSATQEELMAPGVAGTPLGSGERRVVDLPAGRTTTLTWTIRLGTEGREAVNFEQTHLRLSAPGSDGKSKVLLEAAQAGIVDPPAL